MLWTDFLRNGVPFALWQTSRLLPINVSFEFTWCDTLPRPRQTIVAGRSGSEYKPRPSRALP